MGAESEAEGVFPATVPFRLMVAGLALAVKRFREAGRGTDPVAAAIPLFESLNWAVALDERVRIDWVPDGPPPIGWNWPTRAGNEADTEVVRGIRFIRNRVHHQWSNALTLVGPGTRYPPQPFDWVWTRVDRLPKSEKGNNRGEEGYVAMLQGRPADFTLTILVETYEFMIQLLEPRGLAQHWIAEDI